MLTEKPMADAIPLFTVKKRDILSPRCGLLFPYILLRILLDMKEEMEENH